LVLRASIGFRVLAFGLVLLCVRDAQQPLAAPIAHAAAATTELTGTIEILDKDKKHAPGANSIVWIPGLTPASASAVSGPASAAATQMAQQQKRFAPHVLAVAAGTEVSFPNLDPIFHNVFSLTPENKFDLGLYRKGAAKSVRMGAPALVRIYCNIHADMAAFVMVLDHAAFTVTDAEGRYHLPAVPAGAYSVFVWNERTGARNLPLTVDPAAGGAHLDFTLDASAYKPQAHKNKFGRDYPPIRNDVDRY
jgi:plastocyanin